jgi:hypothetical protein
MYDDETHSVGGAAFAEVTPPSTKAEVRKSAPSVLEIKITPKILFV